MKSRTISDLLRRYGAALLLAAGLCVVYYLAAYRLTFVESDYAQHGRWAMVMSRQAMVHSFYDGSERLWHLLVRFTFDHVIHDLYKACALVTAVVDAAAYLLVFAAFEKALSRKFPRWLLAIIAMAPFLATALTVPGGPLYAGAGGLTTWHNPTNIMVRPFAAAVFFMTVRIYNRRLCGEHALFTERAGAFAFEGGFWAQFRRPVYTPGELILYPLCLLFSVYAKPSFLQFFAPAIFLFLLLQVLRTKGMLLPFCIKLALAYIPAALILLMAVRGYFPSGTAVAAETAAGGAEAASADAGIAIYFIKPAFSGIGDFLTSLLGELRYIAAPCAFPFFVFLMSLGRRGTSTVTGLAFVSVLAAFLESVLFHETGYRAAHGNFLWGVYLASWLAWAAAAGEFADLARQRDRRGRIALAGGTVLLLWHLICGIAYLAVILRTGVYYV